jgi:DNA-binding GntR family transcriptional regulator
MNDEHAAIAAACAERDAERVAALLDAHRAHALAHLAEHSLLPAARTGEAAVPPTAPRAR